MRRLRNVTFMTTDPERLASFWAEALGLPERKYSPEEVLLADADWGFPRFTSSASMTGAARRRLCTWISHQTTVCRLSPD